MMMIGMEQRRDFIRYSQPGLCVTFFKKKSHFMFLRETVEDGSYKPVVLHCPVSVRSELYLAAELFRLLKTSLVVDMKEGIF